MDVVGVDELWPAYILPDGSVPEAPLRHAVTCADMVYDLETGRTGVQRSPEPDDGRSMHWLPPVIGYPYLSKLLQLLHVMPKDDVVRMLRAMREVYRDMFRLVQDVRSDVCAGMEAGFDVYWQGRLLGRGAPAPCVTITWPRNSSVTPETLELWAAQHEHAYRSCMEETRHMLVNDQLGPCNLTYRIQGPRVGHAFK